ncbi:hypothetical protein EV192_1172 [Actinocrispum wychmicini]|uniref:Uncharacterized protein n=2 Tax=Actinocrispum wychmicini TaxID=1213861 RepID=A0A4R2IRG6_9PSEU|nr:hypothetical protein EV192_1172 [Actinocrispum wychmicini]
MMEGTNKKAEAAVHTESAELLLKLARPLIADCADLQLQKSLIEQLEKAIKAGPSKFDKYILFVGAFELSFIPDASEEAAVARQVKLINLPSTFEAGKLKVPTHALGANLNGFSLIEEATAAGLVQQSMLTMSQAHQLEYLRKSGIVGKGWKILVEIHYYRERNQITHEFHKDTYGQTLFVNLNYDSDHAISGPEYILNPPPVDEHELQIAESLPKEFLNDLHWVRGQLGEPTEISMSTIPANGYVAFVDEAIHHMTPHYGGRAVKGNEVDSFLKKLFGDKTVEDARQAYREFRWQDSDAISAKLWSVVSARKPFGDFLKVIAKTDAAKWFSLIEVAETSDKWFGRAHLLDAGLGNDQIDTLFAESPNWKGYQRVSIPNAASAPPAKAPLKRQASVEALKGNVPPEVTGNRRFFRTWVRAVRVDQHS